MKIYTIYRLLQSRSSTNMYQVTN